MLTRHGWGALFLAATTAVIGRLFGVVELYVIGAGIVVLVVATAVWVQSRRISLAVQRAVVPLELQVGDVGRVELRITNRSGVGTSPLNLWEPVSGMGGAALQLAPLRRGESTAANYRLPANRRGTVVFGPLTVERRDPFGLSTQSRVIAGTHEVVVLPAHVPLGIPTNGGAGPIGQHLRMRALSRSGTEFHSLRDYVDGDDLRQINWRASARSEVLKVRQVEPEGLRRCTAVLDTTAGEYSAEGFERAVSAAASVLASAASVGLLLRLVIGNEVDLRLVSSTAAMRQLADCAVAPGEQVLTFTAPMGEGIGLTVVVSGSAGSAAVSAARRNLSPNEVMVVVGCTAYAAQPGLFVVDGTDMHEFQRSWTALAGSPSAGRNARRAREAS